MKALIKYGIYCSTLLILGLIFSCKEVKQNKDLKKNDDSVKSSITQEQCMDKIFEKDSELGKIRNHASETKSLSETIDEYTTGLKALNFEDCPNAFEQAFKEHIIAWDNMGKFTENYPALRGEMHDVFNQLEESEQKNTFKDLLKTIWDTWEAIEAAKSISK